MKTIRLATAQFELTHNIDRNLEAILELSKKACAEGSRLIVFPECAISGYPGGDMVDLSGVDPYKVQDALQSISAQAAEMRMFIAAGVALPLDDRRGWTNALVVFDDTGRTAGNPGRRYHRGHDSHFGSLSLYSEVFHS
ncbi:MAG: nitrilase-related carbon-nitrogen hydrolase, partial [Spirochaetia bacterium]